LHFLKKANKDALRYPDPRGRVDRRRSGRLVSGHRERDLNLDECQFPRLPNRRPNNDEPGRAPDSTSYQGQGFDLCEGPSSADMSAWLSSPYRAIGIYIGGSERGCAQPNLTASWVSQQYTAGWRFFPFYVGPQAFCGQIDSPPTTQASEAASDAVTQAEDLGFGSGAPIYYDMDSSVPGCSGPANSESLAL
jgi:hypothetical protein